MKQPKLPVPLPLRGADKGTFAEHTVKVRIPENGRRVLDENELSPEAAAQIEALVGEIPHQTIRPFADTHAPDMPAWQRYAIARQEMNWLEAPWFFVETYFYRRIIAAVDYFRTGFDPFTYQKRQSLTTTKEQTRTLAVQVMQMMAQDWQEEAFVRLLKGALWGNQADMSMWSADDGAQPSHADADAQDAHLLVDASTAVARHLARPSDGPTRVDVIADNAGFELIGDLYLIAYLLQTKQAQTIWLHLKLHPTFVSDATVADVLGTLAWLVQDGDDNLRKLGQKLRGWLKNGRLQLRTHPFWTSPLPLWQMPAELRRELSASSLVVSKGDANYRRALGDAHWAYTTPFADVVSYMPAPSAFLRTCKANLVAGLTPGQPEELAAADPEWLVSGEWGLIQSVGI